MGSIYDTKLQKNGKELKKWHLLFIDGDERTCDCCDDQKICASIVNLIGDVTIVCKDCLMDVVKEFD